MANDLSRTTGNIVILIGREPDSPPLPYELQGHVSSETWEFRMRQVRRLCDQFSKPIFERIWFCLAAVLTFVTPLVLYPVIFNAITPLNLRQNLDNSDTGFNNSFNQFNQTNIIAAERAIQPFFFKARAIVLGVFIGIILIAWGPLVAWKRVGVMRANAMTRRWKEEDSSRGADFVPAWKVTPAGVFTTVGRVYVTFPQIYSQQSLFHPNAQLPPYLVQPSQNGGAPAGGYFYNSGNGGQMYQPGNGGYVPPRTAGGRSPMLVDEKYREDFDEVKV